MQPSVAKIPMRRIMFPSPCLRLRKPRPRSRPLQIGFEDATTLNTALWERLGFCQDDLDYSSDEVCYDRDDGATKLLYLFDNYSLDTDRREMRRGTAVVPLEPQVFDLLEHLIRHRDRVVSKDDLIASIWQGRIVSESTISTQINAARCAIADSGEKQRLIKTIPRRGIRFVGDVREEQKPAEAVKAAPSSERARLPLTLPDRP